MSNDLLKQILNKLENIEAEQQNMKLCQQSMKAQLDENTRLTRALYDRQEETDAKLTSLAEDMNFMKGEMTYLKQGQERHEKILESLAMRSLEQETELRELKRIK